MQLTIPSTESIWDYPNVADDFDMSALDTQTQLTHLTLKGQGEDKTQDDTLTCFWFESTTTTDLPRKLVSELNDHAIAAYQFKNPTVRDVEKLLYWRFVKSKHHIPALNRIILNNSGISDNVLDMQNFVNIDYFEFVGNKNTTNSAPFSDTVDQFLIPMTLNIR